MRKIFGLAMAAMLMLLFGAAPGLAQTIEQTGKELTVTYLEPTTNVDGSALDDLAGTELKITADGEALPSIQVPASAPGGGGLIEQSFGVSAQPNTKTLVTIEAYAFDTSGNAGESVMVEKEIDFLPPGRVRSPQ